MNAIDFSDYERSDKFYGGSEKKIGITVDGHDYMIKFQKNTPFGKRNNHISEYIGSHIFNAIGISAQETYLGYYKKEEVVVCRDFITQGKQFVPFNDVGESTLEHDKDQYQYDYIDIMKMLKDNLKITDVEETISMFWDIYIVDALIGNFDRHGSNWGFIKENNKYSMAPVFDNGSCLYPNLIDEETMNYIVNSEEETNKRVYTFPTSQIRLNNKKSSYYEVIYSLEYKECNEALDRMYGRINIDDIERIIEDTPLITQEQKGFYYYIIKSRYEKILKASWKKL
ncbi:HipA domain-containing protein [uncultured Eubacterium sp.]|uniref:HipA domain-containing protein n=1 Tax=uncultured Eubacterium sp. TaxID=165185 RepID=UPI002591CF1C|nr:HipA domain-containing protein [uncultured Eubacterium sp.]